VEGDVMGIKLVFRREWDGDIGPFFRTRILFPSLLATIDPALLRF